MHDACVLTSTPLSAWLCVPASWSNTLVLAYAAKAVPTGQPWRVCPGLDVPIRCHCHEGYRHVAVRC